MKSKTKKIKLPSIFKLLPIVLFLLTLWMIFLGLRGYLGKSDYFKVKRVEFYGLGDKDLAKRIASGFLYRNIFTLDLKDEQEELSFDYPQFYSVRILKQLPDLLNIAVIQRKPSFQVKTGSFFLVDEEGMIISLASLKAFNNFIVLKGLRASGKFSFGKKIDTNDFKIGLNVIRLIKKNFSKWISYFSSLVDVNKDAAPSQAADISNIEVDLSKFPSIYLYLNKIEIRLHKDSFEKNIALLDRILDSVKDKIDTLNYIELRFNEPAVSFKTKSEKLKTKN